MAVTQATPKQHRKNTAEVEAAVDAGPGPLGRVREGLVVLWARGDGAALRCREGAIIPLSDPMLNTGALPAEFCERHGLDRDNDQRWKLEPAPEGSEVTPHTNEGARKAYLELQYPHVQFGAVDEDGVRRPLAATPRVVPGNQQTKVSVPPVDEPPEPSK
jgi:hypothetical protein